MSYLYVLDMLGIAVFAVSGALAANLYLLQEIEPRGCAFRARLRDTDIAVHQSR